MKNMLISLFFMAFTSLQVLYAQCIDSSLIMEFKACEDNFWPEDFELYYNPVCGCDGKTYFSTLCAINNGVTEWTWGECDPCFDTLRETPQPFHFLIYSGSPRFVDIPRAQVCGCDGKTYLNPYTAYRAGNTQWEKGSCSCIDSSVINLSIDFEACEELIYKRYDWIFLEPHIYKRFRYLKGCDGKFYNNFCEAYHKYGVTRFVSLWEEDCLKLPEEQHQPDFPCTTEYSPVCGCDWVTYQNACIAEKHHGIIEYYEGECNCADSALIGVFNNYDTLPLNSVCFSDFDHHSLNAVCGCDGNVYFNDCYAFNQAGVPTFTECPCIREDAIDLSQPCDSTFLRPGCGCDGNVYRNTCEAYFKNGVTSISQCDCIEPDLIDTTAECNEIFHWEPVCGCDGRTYPNMCVASLKHGVTLALSDRPCENTCKDSVLIIEEVPCNDAYYPVCGCDMITYQNECHARYKNGVLKWEPGPCTLSSNADHIKDMNISVYPNPSAGLLYLSGISRESYQIMDSTGKIVQDGPQQLVLDISMLKSGMYFLRLFYEDKSFVSFKVIKI